jgi:hypothetical protein
MLGLKHGVEKKSHVAGSFHLLPPMEKDEGLIDADIFILGATPLAGKTGMDDGD